MKLSQEYQLLVEGRYSEKRLKLTPKYRQEIQKARAVHRSKSDVRTEIIRLHTEYVQELGDSTIEAYLNAYRADGQMPDENEIVEITNKVSYWLRQEIAAAVMHLPIDLALSTETGHIIRDTMELADKRMRNAVRESELQSKGEKAKQMEQQSLIERDKKRHQLLRLIYNEAKGNANVRVADGKLKKAMGLTQDEFFGLYDYLKGDGLVKVETIGSTMLTHYGIKHIEESMKNPDSTSEQSEKGLADNDRTLVIPNEGSYQLIKPLIGYKGDIEAKLKQFSFDKNVFLMMKFRESNKLLSDFIIGKLKEHGLNGVRADHTQWNITSNVYNPLAVLYCCKYGVALFDEPEENQAYSPNVAYELGIMHYQHKRCLILRHNSLPLMFFDLIKDLYRTYSKDLEVQTIIKEWIEQIG